MKIDEITHTAGRMNAASIDETVTEIGIVAGKIQSRTSIFERFSFSDYVKLDSHAIAEIDAGIAFTASLSAYRRDGEAWRFNCAGRDSSRVKQIRASLDTLRDLLIARSSEAFRFCYRQTSPSHVVRGLALLVPRPRCGRSAQHHGIQEPERHPSVLRDPQGDARLLAAERHLSTEHGLWAELEFKQTSRKLEDI